MKPKQRPRTAVRIPQAVRVSLSALKPHPANYRTHPDSQLDHIKASLKEHGQYRNVVVADDLTILAGHGVVEAARALNMAELTVIRLPVKPDSTTAMKILTGDNEISRLADIDDYKLTEMLMAIKDKGGGLMGTGFDEREFVNLMLQTRTREEIKNHAHAASAVGVGWQDPDSDAVKLFVTFTNPRDRDQFVNEFIPASYDRTKNRFRWKP